MPLKMKAAFILAVTLLFPALSIQGSVPTAAATFLSAAPNPEAKALEKDTTTLDKYELESRQPEEAEYNMEGLASPEDFLEHIATILSGTEAATALPRDIVTREASEERARDTDELPKESDKAETDGTEEEILSELNNSAASILNFMRLIKRAAEDSSEGDERNPSSIDEDAFSFSDLTQILGPLVRAFSAPSESEPPATDDFFSWFPALKDLLNPGKEASSTAKPTALPRNSITGSARRSGHFPTSPKPSLQISPAVAQPTASARHSSSSPLEESAARAQPATREPSSGTPRNAVEHSTRPPSSDAQDLEMFD